MAESADPKPAEADTPTDPTLTAVIAPILSLNIHSLVSASQSAHGIRHDDYAQYRAYCTRRLSRIRHARPVRRDLVHSVAYRGAATTVTAVVAGDAPAASSKDGNGGGGGGGNKKGSTPGGRHAFRPTDRSKLPSETLAAHDNYALEALYSSERCWSHALEIKSAGGANQSNGSSASPPPPGKVRSHSLRRLRKAAGYATELEELAGKTLGEGGCDDRTRVEARAYGCWMRGNLGLESGDWQSACTEYTSALTICRALASSGGGDGEQKEEGALEMRDFFAARAEHVIEPLLRYCQYELQEGGMTQSEMLSFVSSQEDAEADLLAASATSQLQSKLDSIRNENIRSQVSGGSMSVVKFRGHDVPVENKELRVTLLKVADLRKQQQKASEGKGKKGSDDSKLMSLLSGYDDAAAIVAKELREYRGMKSGPAVNAKRFQAGSLLGYVKHEKLKLLMGRNEGMANDIISEAADGATAKSEPSLKHLEEVAHLYDALLQDARAVAALPGGGDGSGEDEGEGAGPVEDEFLLEANANVLRLRALRCYYLARMHAADGVEKHDEAYALFEQASSLALEAEEEIAACEEMEGGDDLITSMEALRKEIEGAKCRAQACAYLARVGGSSASSGRSLMRRLEDFDSGGETYCLAHVPPKLEPMACKPTFFDVALNYVSDYPVDELQKVIDENTVQSKGILGWFRRG